MGKVLKILYSRAFQNIENQNFLQPWWINFVGKSRESFILVHLRKSKFKMFFNYGELILLKKSRKSFLLVHFTASKFKTIFNHGEPILWRKSWKSFIFVHFRTSKFQNFLQPWWTNYVEKVMKIINSCAFQNIEIQYLL